mmetsp:Transcript_56036/g.67267  ORF Transcript_56036/g.67267 Transcript_56036/m.67267 type:complete len:191 (-) Transcript_56036:370-942(-)
MILSPLPPLLLLITLLPTPSQSWGRDGHEIIGNIAYNRLTSSAREAINIILGNITTDSDSNTPLGAMADWADQIRNKLKWSGKLHYIDIPDDSLTHGCHWSYERKYVDSSSYETRFSDRKKDEEDDDDWNHCMFVYERDCIDDACVAGAITNYTSRLYDNLRAAASSQEMKMDEATRAMLKFVGTNPSTF